MSKKTYAQKASTFWKVWKANPKITISQMQKRYEGTKFSMRRQDIGHLLKGFNTTGNYQDAKATTKHSLKGTAKKVKASEKFLILESPTYVLPEPEQENINYLQGVCEKAFRDGMKAFGTQKKRYSKYQIQLLVLTEIEKDGEENPFIDYIASNAFPLELNITFDMVWGSFIRNLNKLTQSLLGKVLYLESKSKLILWHR